MADHLINTDTSTDWIACWTQRVADREAWRKRDTRALQGDRWKHRAVEFARSAPARSAARRRTKTIFEAILSEIAASPHFGSNCGAGTVEQRDTFPSQGGVSVLDIGAGTGVWTVYFAQHGCRVTAIEPSPSMAAELVRACEPFPGGQVTILEKRWPEIEVDAHDIVLCAHVLYGARDFRAWITSMTQAARIVCVVTLRAPKPDDLFLEAADIIGEDGAPPMPDAHLAIRALRQMGVQPFVLFEEQGAPRDTVYPDLESMVQRVKRDYHVPEHCRRHDAALRDRIARSALAAPDGFTFPPRARNAIILWQPEHATLDVSDQLGLLQETQ